MHRCSCGECGEFSYQIIKKSESGKSIILNNDRKILVKITKLDGCVVCNATACDWIFHPNNSNKIFVELKGSDVIHGLAQLKTSIKEYGLGQELLAILVCRVTHPKISTFIQNEKVKFKKIKSKLLIGGPSLAISV